MSSLEDGTHLPVIDQPIIFLDLVSSQTSSMVASNVVVVMKTGYKIELGFTGGIAEFLGLVLVTILIAATKGLLAANSM